MPLYIADYLADTAHLDAAQSGAYLHLIMHYWQKGSLPADDEALRRIAKMTSAEWRRSKEIISQFFCSGWRHKRIDDELAKAAKISNKRKAAAEQMHANKSANAHANAEQMHTQPQPPSHAQKIGGGGEPPADEAFSVASSLAAICGFPTPLDWPPGWCGAPNWVSKCLAEGWKPEVMRAETEATVKRKRDGPIEHYSYLEKPLARAHARHLAPLPKVETSKQETVYARSGKNGLASHLERLGQIADDLEGHESISEGGKAPLRLLSHG